MSSILPRHRDNVAENFSTVVAAERLGRGGHATEAHWLLEGHRGSVYAARFCPRAELIASGGADGRLFLWAAGGECAPRGASCRGRGQLLDLCFAPDAARVFAAGSDGRALCFDVETLKSVRKFAQHTDVVNAVAISASGGLLLTVSNDGSALAWDPDSPRPVARWPGGWALTACCFGAAPHQFFTAGIDNSICERDLRAAGCVSRAAAHADTVTSLHLCADGSVLSHGMDAACRLWRWPAVAKSFSGHSCGPEQALSRARASPAGRLIAAAGLEAVALWSLDSERPVMRLGGHRGTVNDVDLTDAGRVVSAAADGSLYVSQLPAEIVELNGSHVTQPAYGPGLP